MKLLKKNIALLLAALLLFGVCSAPANAVSLELPSRETVKTAVERGFYQTLDRLIVGLGAVLNAVIPGLNWVGGVPRLQDYKTHDFYAGKQTFDASPDENARWHMGFSRASFLSNIDPLDGNYYLAGALGVMKGKVPGTVADDQGVNTFALSDGTATVTFSSIDGFGLTRGDVQEIRSRLAAFAKEHGVDSVNVAAVHQHSCIDTLGLGVPIVPALLNNPAAILLGGKHLTVGRNERFMEEVYSAVTRTVTEAVESMTAGTLYHGSADISKHIWDKRDPQVFDGTFHRLRFVPDDGGREIWIGEAGVHPVTAGGDDDPLSADYPHYLEAYINEHADADFVFMQGAELAISSNGATFDYDPAAGDMARTVAMGETFAKELMAVQNEEALVPLLNIAHREVTVSVNNPVHIIAGREGLLASVMCRKGLGYAIVTELGYMELGGKLGVVLAPGEIEPALLWGGAIRAQESWTGKAWNYAPWAQTCGAETLLCFGLCNDQIGYVLCDNDYRSMLTENEEINAVSRSVGSALTEAFAALVASVK